MEAITTPLNAIKIKCLDCSCGSSKEVRLCPVSDCVLFPFRMGKNPFRKKSVEKRLPSVRQLEALNKGRDSRQIDKDEFGAEGMPYVCMPVGMIFGNQDKLSRNVAIGR